MAQESKARMKGALAWHPPRSSPTPAAVTLPSSSESSRALWGEEVLNEVWWKSVM